MDAVTVAMYK